MSPQLRLTLVFGLIAGAWLLISDEVVSWALGNRADRASAVEPVKDAILVVATSIALFALLRRAFRSRQEREQALAANEQQFRDLFQHNPVPMYTVDRTTGQFVDVNRAALELYGYSQDEFRSMSITDIRTPEDATLVSEAITQVESHWTSGGVWRHLRKNGDQLIVEVATTRIDFGGRATNLGAVRDVTMQTQLQQALEATNRTLKTIVDASPLSIYAVDRDSRVTVWNPASEQLYGWSAEEIVGQEIRNIPRAKYAEAEALKTRVLAGEELLALELERLRKDGTTALIRVAAAPTRDNDGNITGILVIAQDVGAEKEAQRAIRQLAAIVQSSDDAIIGGTLDGMIASWNPGAECLYGYRAEEVIGKPILMLAPPDLPDETLSILARLGRGERLDHFEMVGQTKDGRRVDIFVSAFPIDNADTGVASAVIARDITGRKQADAQLTYQANLLQNVSDTIIGVDNEWRVTSWNKAAETLYGWTADEVMGQRPDVFLRTEYIGTSIDEVLRTFQEVGQWQGEVIEYRKDGTPLHLFNSTAVLRDASGKIIGAVGIERDITWKGELAAEMANRQRLQAELEQELDMRTVRSSFASMVSHEFRTPLAAIQSSTDLLRHYSHRMSEEQRQDRLRQVQDQVQHITELLNDFLTLSRMETVGVQFAPEPADLTLLIRETVIAAQASWPARRIDLDTKEGFPPFFVDRKLIQQAVLNLLANAIKYSPADSVVVVRLMATGDTARIEVQDYGIGIPDADQARLFEPFFRASNVGGIEGTGLGLAIVRRAAEAHGGAVTIASTSGVGTTIGFTLPRTHESGS